jgi:hypothetical protein
MNNILQAVYTSNATQTPPNHKPPAKQQQQQQQQRWVIAIKKKNQLPTTLPIILYLVIGITN